MKLQYLGDYRDAFKWDLLHWTCTQARPRFGKLVFVPFLTPDDAVPRDGQIPHTRFEARPFIDDFVARLGETPRTLERIERLGTQAAEAVFEITIHRPHECMPSGGHRAAY